MPTLREVQQKATYMNWTVESHRKGYLIRQPQPAGYPEDNPNFVVATLDEALQNVEEAISFKQTYGSPTSTSDYATTGKAQVVYGREPRKPFHKWLLGLD